jgi:hypothetical protein
VAPINATSNETDGGYDAHAVDTATKLSTVSSGAVEVCQKR